MLLNLDQLTSASHFSLPSPWQQPFHSDSMNLTILDHSHKWTYTGFIFCDWLMSLRIMLLIVISSSLTYTTTPNDLTDGIESLLSPLKFIGLKSAVHTLALMMTIALRFIPTLVEEAEKIMNAQKARGADLESGNLKQRIKALIPILVPLLISSVRRALELAEAMECRCYNGGEGKTRMKQLRVSAVDFYIVGVTLLFFAGVILLNIFF